MEAKRQRKAFRGVMRWEKDGPIPLSSQRNLLPPIGSKEFPQIIFREISQTREAKLAREREQLVEDIVKAINIEMLKLKMKNEVSNSYEKEERISEAPRSISKARGWLRRIAQSMIALLSKI